MISSLNSFINLGNIDGLLNQLLGLTLFLMLAFLSYGLIRYYLPEILEQNFSVYAGISGLVSFAFLAFFLSSFPYSLFFLGVVLSLICGISILHPALALANMVGFLILRPWELLPDQDSLMVLPRGLLILFVCSVVMDMFRKKNYGWNKDKSQLWVIGLGAWVFLSTFISGNAGEAQAVFFDGFFKSLVIAVMIYQALKTTKDYELVTGSIVISVFGVSLFALINTYYVVAGDRLEGRGAIQNANDLAAILIFVLPFSLKAILKKEFKLGQWLFSGMILVALALGVWKAQSRAAYMSIFLMGLTWLVYKFRDHKKLIAQLGGIAVVGLLVVSQLNLGRSSSDLEESRMNRLGYWKAGVSMAVRNPVFGVGFGQFPNNYQNYGAADFTETGARTAHSSWILLLSEAGFPALVLVILLFLKAARKAWSLMDEAPELLLSLVGYGMCMTFLSHIYTIYPYILLSLIFAYPKLSDKTKVAAS